jgi:hypothetical protein
MRVFRPTKRVRLGCSVRARGRWCVLLKLTGQVSGALVIGGAVLLFLYLMLDLEVTIITHIYGRLGLIDR